MLARSARQPYICSRCLDRARREFSTSTDSLAPPPPPPSGRTKLSTRRLISLHGQDAPKFLQGTITNNLRPESRTGFFSAFLTAQGKVLHDVFVYPTVGSRYHNERFGTAGDADEHGYLVEMDAEQAPGLLKHIKRHKLRAKLQVRLLEEGELDVWSAWREDDKWTAHTSYNAHEDSGIIGLTDSRAPGMGQRILLPSDADTIRDVPMLAELDTAPLSAYTIRRYLRGVPEGQREIPHDGAFPMNANLDIMGGIDFRKGCYIGQELTIRTHHTGVVRRRVLPVQLYNIQSAPPEKAEYLPSSGVFVPEAEADIKRQGKKGRSTGKWIAGVGNVGLATCRLEQMTDLIVSGEGSSFAPEDRFVVQGSGGRVEEMEVGVKAFVPDWLRGRVRAPKLQKKVE